MWKWQRYAKNNISMECLGQVWSVQRESCHSCMGQLNTCSQKGARKLGNKMQPPSPPPHAQNKMTHMRAKNIPTPCCSNSWVRKVQLNYVNAEMNVLCRTSTGDTCRDCSDISSCERLCCISLDVLNARKKKKKWFQELSCCGDCDVFCYFLFLFLHLACQRSLLITLPFIRAGGLSRSTWEQGQDGETVASQAIENALVLPAGAAQLSDPDADVHRQHLLGCFGSLLTQLSGSAPRSWQKGAV